MYKYIIGPVILVRSNFHKATNIKIVFFFMQLDENSVRYCVSVWTCIYDQHLIVKIKRKKVILLYFF